MVGCGTPRPIKIDQYLNTKFLLRIAHLSNCTGGGTGASPATTSASWRPVNRMDEVEAVNGSVKLTLRYLQLI